MKGLSVERLKSGPALARLHYTADPGKDPATPEGAIWLPQAAMAYAGGLTSLGWRREMEMDPTAGHGELALPWFDERSPKVLIQGYEPGEDDRLYGGLDVGLNNPTAFLVAALRPDGILVYFWEFYQKHVLLNEMARAVRQCPYYDRLEWIACDPTIWNRNQYKKDEMTSLAMMLQEDVPPELRLDKIMRAHERSDMRFIQRISMMMLDQSPRVLISKEGCPFFIRELRNIRYMEATANKNNSEKLVDKDNHAWDAGKYLALSHPDLKNQTPKQKFGSIGHLKAVAARAQAMSEEFGMSYEEAFTDAYY